MVAFIIKPIEVNVQKILPLDEHLNTCSAIYAYAKKNMWLNLADLKNVTCVEENIEK